MWGAVTGETLWNTVYDKFLVMESVYVLVIRSEVVTRGTCWCHCWLWTDQSVYLWSDHPGQMSIPKVNRLRTCNGLTMTPYGAGLNERQRCWFACVVFNQQFSVCTPFMHYGWGTSWTTSSPFVLPDAPVTSQEKPMVLWLCWMTETQSRRGAADQTGYFFTLLYCMSMCTCSGRNTGTCTYWAKLNWGGSKFGYPLHGFNLILKTH